MGKNTILALVAALVAAGCAAMPGASVNDDTTTSPTSTSVTSSTSGATGSTSTTSTTSSTSGGSSAGGAAPECEVDADCGVSDHCATALCQAGQCNNIVHPAGHALPDQVAGDCAAIVCNGAGGTMSVPYPADAPASECATSICAPGPVLENPLEIGTACSGGLCDGAGVCLPHIPVKCIHGLIGGWVTGCDGASHAGEYIKIVYHKVVIIDPDTSIHSGGNCFGAPADVGYCEPGAACEVHFTNGTIVPGVCE